MESGREAKRAVERLEKRKTPLKFDNDNEDTEYLVKHRTSGSRKKTETVENILNKEEKRRKEGKPQVVTIDKRRTDPVAG